MHGGSEVHGEVGSGVTGGVVGGVQVERSGRLSLCGGPLHRGHFTALATGLLLPVGGRGGGGGRGSGETPLLADNLAPISLKSTTWLG